MIVFWRAGVRNNLRLLRDPKDFGQAHDRFSDALLDLGYDVAISPTVTTMVMLVIKPGGNLNMEVETLISSDNGSRDYLAMVHGKI